MTVTRDTVAGRAYLDLQNKARRDRRPTDELLQLYALEGFLDRLTRSRHRHQLVLKGGVLLAALDTRRPTRDVDLRAEAIANDTQTVLDVVRDIVAIQLDDGLTFAEPATAVPIRDEDQYGGVRVTVPCQLATARLSFHVDVNIGDPMTPAPRAVSLPRLLGGTIQVRGYPLAMVLAEKIVTAIARGRANTRWRDFYDLHQLSGNHAVDGAELRSSIQVVAAHRDVHLRPLGYVLARYPATAQTRWAAWLRKQRLDEQAPRDFATLLAAVIEFADPVLGPEPRPMRWNHQTRQWTT